MLVTKNAIPWGLAETDDSIKKAVVRETLYKAISRMVDDDALESTAHLRINVKFEDDVHHLYHDARMLICVVTVEDLKFDFSHVQVPNLHPEDQPKRNLKQRIKIMFTGRD